MRRAISLLVAVVWVAAVHAASPPVYQAVPSYQINPQVIQLPPLVFSASVAAGGCVRPGAKLTIAGRYFGNGTGRGVALGSSGGPHIPLTVSSWSDTQIVAVVPSTAALGAGKTYFAAVEKADHSAWLSNIDRKVTACTTVLQLHQPLVPRTQGFAPVPGGGTPPSEPGEEDGGYGEGSYGGGNGGGGLSGGAAVALDLPPPPPPVEAKSQDADNVEPGEVVVVSQDMNAAMALAGTAQGMGLSVRRRTRLQHLGFVLSVFRVPQGTTVNDALTQLRAAQPDLWADANHRLRLQGEADPRRYGAALVGWGPAQAGCGAGARIGVVDTGVDLSQPALAGRKITVHRILSAGVAMAKPDHGTAVAALLAGASGSAAPGLLPEADVFVAQVVRRRDKQEDTTAEDVARALDWLDGQHVTVVNLSLGGPRNLLVELAVQRLLEQGVAVVAAAGNGGADAAPVYPAAQKGVLAVTAVDAKMRVWDDANAGAYVALAAPGVDVWVARPGGGGGYVSGTSYAVPFVTAAVAAVRARQPETTPAQVADELERAARDLGAPGRDPVFGFGLLQPPAGCGR